MGLTITKLANGNVEVTSTDAAFQPYSLMPNFSVYRNKSGRIDGVDVQSVGVVKAIFPYEKVDNVVRDDATDTTITSGDVLYNELNTYFFFR
ncbi:MAG: hypothetical protein COA36_16645 [Desulfotalea sp.]|nr:MAG: hypothetical protein COA36_16645 [Desulfotalea sp.]